MDRMLQRTLLWVFVLTLAISTALFISLIVRESISPTLGHFVVLVAPIIPLLLSWRYFRTIPVLVLCNVAFVITVLPMAFSFIYLYIPSFLMLAIVTMVVVANAIKNRIHRSPETTS